MQAWDIEFRALSVGYGEHVVLRDVNAVLPGGKVSVILGGSGCGKSTLLRHIIGLSRPQAGQVLIGNNDLFGLPQKEFRRMRRNMGVLFQDGALLGALLSASDGDTQTADANAETTDANAETTDTNTETTDADANASAMDMLG